MTFSINKVTKTYNARGDVIATKEETVFNSWSALASIAYRYENANGGHVVSVNDREGVFLETKDANGDRVFFADLFKHIEGEEAFNDVMNGDAPSENEAEYIGRMWAA